MQNINAKDIYNIPSLSNEEKSVYRKVNQTIKKFDEEINNFRFNTAIASLMELLNELTKNIDKCSKEIQAYSLSRFAVMISSVAPHLGEECWQLLGNETSIFEKPVWFDFDKEALVEDSVNIAVQVNGKLRTTIEMPINSEQSIVKDAVFKEEKIINYIQDKTIVKEIYVKNKIYNVVVK